LPPPPPPPPGSLYFQVYPTFFRIAPTNPKILVPPLHGTINRESQ